MLFFNGISLLHATLSLVWFSLYLQVFVNFWRYDRKTFHAIGHNRPRELREILKKDLSSTIFCDFWATAAGIYATGTATKLLIKSSLHFHSYEPTKTNKFITFVLVFLCCCSSLLFIEDTSTQALSPFHLCLKKIFY